MYTYKGNHDLSADALYLTINTEKYVKTIIWLNSWWLQKCSHQQILALLPNFLIYHFLTFGAQMCLLSPP